MAKQKVNSEGVEVKSYNRAELLEISIRFYERAITVNGLRQTAQFSEAVAKDCINLGKQFLDVFESAGEEA